MTGVWLMNKKKGFAFVALFTAGTALALYFFGETKQEQTPNSPSTNSANVSQSFSAHKKDESQNLNQSSRTPTSTVTPPSGKVFNSFDQIEREFSTKLVVESRNGRVRTVYGKIPFATDQSETPAIRASRFLSEASPALGVDVGQMSYAEVSKVGPFHVTRFRQDFGGYAVIPGEVAIFEDQNGNIVTVNNFTVPIPPGLSLTPAIDAAEALQSAQNGRNGVEGIREPQLVIHLFNNNSVELAWMLKVGRRSPPLEEICFVGAQSRRVEKSPTLAF